MKYILLLLLSCNCFAQIKINDTIYGQVRSYRETIVLLDPSKETTSTADVFLDPFDLPILGRHEKKPEHISSLWYNYPWVELINYYREYDNKGRKIKEKWENITDDLEAGFLYKHDTLNRVTEIKEIDEKGEIGTTERRNYNHKGQLVALFTDYGEGYSYECYEYNDKNQCTKKDYFDEYGKQGETLYEYENGKKRRLKTVSNQHTIRLPNGGRTTTTGEWTERLVEEYFYDERGNLIKTCSYSSVINDGATEPSCGTHTYDNNGNETAKYINGELQGITTYYKDGKTKKIQNAREGSKIPYLEYYYKGDLLTKVIFVEDATKKYVITFDYTFDDNHNWIKQVKSINGKPEFLRSRTILYYKPFDFLPEGN